MIVDASVINELLFGENSRECQKLRKMIVDGKVPLRIPDTDRYEIIKKIVEKDVEPKVLQQLLLLVSKFLEYATVEMTVDQLSKAVELCNKLGISLSPAACLILASQFGEVYITADTSVASKLKKKGYPVLHMKELFSL